MLENQIQELRKEQKEEREKHPFLRQIEGILEKEEKDTRAKERQEREELKTLERESLKRTHSQMSHDS